VSPRPFAETPEAVHALWDRFYADEDLEGLASLFAPDAVIVMDSREIRGVDEIRAALGGFLAQGLAFSASTRNVHRQEDLAFLAGAWRTHPRDEPENVTSGISAEVVRREPDGRWRYVIDIPGFIEEAPPTRAP
jgi:uncharacterized protein (TIGR02246 family)